MTSGENERKDVTAPVFGQKDAKQEHGRSLEWSGERAGAWGVGEERPGSRRRCTVAVHLRPGRA